MLIFKCLYKFIFQVDFRPLASKRLHNRTKPLLLKTNLIINILRISIILILWMKSVYWEKIYTFYFTVITTDLIPLSSDFHQ